jgi:hypothetical protein
MDDEHFTAQQIAAVTMAIYPFVEAYGLPMNPDDVELLAVAVLGATPERSLDELLERSKRLLADDRERAAQILEGMKQRQLVEREDSTGEETTIAERRNEAMSRIALDLPEETRLAVASWVFQGLMRSMRYKGTFRTLIYGDLGFSRGSGAYSVLYSAGAMHVSNALLEAIDPETTDESGE